MATDSPTSRNASLFSQFLLIEEAESVFIAFSLMKLQSACSTSTGGQVVETQVALEE